MAKLEPEQRNAVISRVTILLSPDTKDTNEHMRDKAERLVNLADTLRERMAAHDDLGATQILAVALASIGADDRTHAAVAEVAADEMDVRVTADLVGLVMSPAPTVDDVRDWTEEQIREVDRWASLVHLSASDNDNEVPEKPAVLIAWEADHAGTGS